MPIPEDAEHFGIQFSLGTFMPSLLPAQLVDRALTLPAATSTSFWLDGSAFELPGPDDADAFVERLADAGLLVHDPLASAALQGEVEGLSRRSMERRVSRATGLRRGLIRQVRRAETAVELLARGMSAAESAARAGYADQPHLSRSLKRFVGVTPSQIVPCSIGRLRRLSLSFKTHRPRTGRRAGHPAVARPLGNDRRPSGDTKDTQAMPQLINSTYITLDGVIEDPHLWPALKGGTSDELGTIQTDLLQTCDIVLMGRRTYDVFAPAWSSRSGDPYSDRINAMRKVVVSTTLTDPEWTNTEVISSDVVDRVRDLKARGRWPRRAVRIR